jgi:predicted RNA binding protein YcfA (HicA-like mRNA interferase family)
MINDKCLWRITQKGENRLYSFTCIMNGHSFKSKQSKSAKSGEKNFKAAAFYDLEGTLISTNLVHTLGFYARRQQGLFQTFKKSAQTLAKLPFLPSRICIHEMSLMKFSSNPTQVNPKTACGFSPKNCLRKF